MSETTSSPMIRLEENGAAPVLRYDIPEPTSYSGVNLIELPIDQNAFRAELLEVEHDDSVAEALRRPDALRTRLRTLASGSLGSRVGFAVDIGSGVIPPEPVPPSDEIPDDILDALVDRLSAGDRLVVSNNAFGTPTVSTAPVPDSPRPRLYLVETLRLTSYLGDYGAGRVVKTMTLLPGESTKISVTTFRETEEKRTQASSVLDSVTNEAATDLEQSIQSEQSSQESFKESTSYYGEVAAKANWGWGGASAKAGIKGGTESARQEATKNLANATERHASKASSKREVDIDTSYEASSKQSEQVAIEREISNVNVSRTLNFVFRQMNQEFITFIHLTDVRVGYFDGFGESRREVPLADLGDLLDDVIEEAQRSEVEQMVLEALSDVVDWRGQPIKVVDDVPVPNSNATLRRFTSRVEAVTIGQGDDVATFRVPGVVLDVKELVMRTDGVIVESLLGEGDALDDYAAQLQSIEVDRRRAEADLLAARAARAALINDIIGSGDAMRADVVERALSGQADDDDS